MNRFLPLFLLMAALALYGCNHDLDSVALPCKENVDCPIKGQRCVNKRCVVAEADAGSDGPAVDAKAGDAKKSDSKPDKATTLDDATTPDKTQTLDKAVPQPDKATPTPDKAVPQPDKAVPQPDKAVPQPDKAVPQPDKAVPQPDKAAPTPDKTPPTPDQAVPAPDMPPTTACGVKKTLSSTSATGSYTGRYPTLRLQPNGDMYLACAKFDSKGFVVHAAKPAGKSWGTMEEYSYQQSGAIGGMSLDVDASGYKHIAYQDLGSGGHVKYISNKNGGMTLLWQQLVTGQTTGVELSIGAYSNSRVAVSHHNQKTNELWLSSNLGGKYDTSTSYKTITSNGRYTSLQVDSADTYHIAFVDPSSKGVKYYHSSTSQVETVHALNASNDDTALVLDKKGVPHVAYRRTDGVWYAVRTGTNTWDTTLVEKNLAAGRNISLALDTAGNAYVVHTDSAPGPGRVLLQSNKCSKTKWTKKAVDTSSKNDFGTAVAVHNGVVHVLYHSIVAKDLKYLTECITCTP